ncbi:MAG: hypothetical protein CMQ61_12850, partial [Gammaproteobacteria bacterium]|nr:hypothetical protein [Gammaproteobacteria bacterium]
PHPDESAIERHLQEALDLARRMNAHLPELRAATGLARLWQTQNRAQEAQALLKDSLAWFQEGFDAPALKEASQLIDTLKAA